MPVRVAVANESAIVTAGLETMLQPYPARVRFVNSSDTDLAGIGLDILLYDPANGLGSMPARVQEVIAHTNVRLVAFGWKADRRHARAAIADGAVGFIRKSASPGELVEQLERIHHGHHDSPESDWEALEHWLGSEHGLSRRESEVLALICRGLSNVEISQRAYIGINTVKTYIRTAYRKIGVTTRPQAIIWAISHGFEGTERRQPSDVTFN